ncbi:DUF4249 family protein [Hymenobacter sediminicola]|uniref:DUF4249 family protein n=1 Tax=Hymenobacter sediminicola TaxID=2761579 RepID=A0A7G7W5F8_9BACT|nr:DUF4249 family protein [Hymenobacter sediminicola]QNH61601.1 DUF4249 family protein [Hymenobacter sediminicola]
MKKLFPISAVALLALSGCETVVDVDTPPHTPRLALSYTLSNQPATPDYRAFFEVRDLFVSGSQGVLETRQLAGRQDATIQLFDESGQVVEQFRSKARSGSYGYYGQDSLYGYYVPTRNFVGVPGRTYTLRASASGLEPVEATLTLPAVPTIERAEFVVGTPTYGYGGRLTVSVADAAASADYYLAYARVLDRTGRYWGEVYPDYNAPGSDGPDINLGRFQLSSAYGLYSQYPFSDVGGNGQRLSFSSDVLLQYRGTYDPYNPVIPEPAFLEVIVSGITPDTYRFYQSLLRYYDTDGNPFAEPAPLHSNVRSGYGLFGGTTDAVYRISL